MLEPTKILLETPPYRLLDDNRSWLTRGIWPASWVGCPGAETPFVAAYRCRFRVEEPAVVRVHVTADERYTLFLDGSRIGSGPERGDPANWFFDTYDLPLAPGDHVLAAQVQALGPAAPRAQMSVVPGFLLSPDADTFRERLATGAGAWEVTRLEGYAFTRPFDHDFFSIGYNTTIDGSRFGGGFERGEGDDWKPAVVLHAGSDAEQRTRIGASVHRLRPATLPALLNRPWQGGQVRFVSGVIGDSVPVRAADSLPGDVLIWQAFLRSGDAVTLPPHTERRVLIDLETYLTAHARLEMTGGSGGQVRVHWAESLFDTPDSKTKGNRDKIENKYFMGVGDTFLPGGGAHQIFETLLWRAGRYLELRVKTGGEPLTLHRLTLTETRYPLEQESVFESDDVRFARLFRLAARTLQASCHDAYIDGPFYEQMMWAGDGVQNLLTTFVLTRDDRPARRWLSLLDASRDASGLTCARWPARDRLTVAPYSLYWTQMVGQFALWRDDPAFIRSLLPGVRSVLDAFEQHRNDDGLLFAPPGWNFVDWVPGWRDGVPPGGDRGASAVLNGQLAWTLAQCADLEAAHGEPEIAQLYRRRAREITDRITDAFWSEERGLFADDAMHTSFSEHAQCFAILSGLVPPEKCSRIAEALLTDASLTRATISFTHYLFETFRVLGRGDALFDRLNLWFALEAQGFKTLPEGPEPARSDCHAWGAHPLFHAFTTIAGIRPAAPGFAAVHITPQMGPLSHLDCTLPHPRGEIRLSLRHRDPGDARRAQGTVTLPDGVTGSFFWQDRSAALQPGLNRIE